MSECNDLSFCELRMKEVVNSNDGKRLGRIIDVVFSCESGGIKGIVVPFMRRSLFTKCQELFIPWSYVVKIGEDVIIVSLNGESALRCGCEPVAVCPPKETECEREKECDSAPKECERKLNKKGEPECDRRCEKCMLFDCSYRWKGLNRASNRLDNASNENGEIYIDNKKYK